MKKLLFTIAIVLSYVSVAWAPPPGAVVVREGDNIGPANINYGLIIGALTAANAPFRVDTGGIIHMEDGASIYASGGVPGFAASGDSWAAFGSGGGGTTYNAGNGLDLAGTTFSADNAVLHFDSEASAHAASGSDHHVATVAGDLDHGGFNGLSDDDHPIYATTTELLSDHAGSSSAHHVQGAGGDGFTIAGVNLTGTGDTVDVDDAPSFAGSVTTPALVNPLDSTDIISWFNSNGLDIYEEDSNDATRYGYLSIISDSAQITGDFYSWDGSSKAGIDLNGTLGTLTLNATNTVLSNAPIDMNAHGFTDTGPITGATTGSFSETVSAPNFVSTASTHALNVDNSSAPTGTFLGVGDIYTLNGEPFVAVDGTVKEQILTDTFNVEDMSNSATTAEWVLSTDGAGNTYWREGVGSVPFYASIYADNVTVVINTVDLDTVASAGWALGEMNGISYNSTTGIFTIGAGGAGEYEVDFSVSISGQTNAALHYHLHINGTGTPKVESHRKLSGGDIGNAAMSNQVTFAVGDTIKVMTQQDSGTTNQALEHGSFSLNRIDPGGSGGSGGFTIAGVNLTDNGDTIDVDAWPVFEDLTLSSLSPRIIIEDTTADTDDFLIEVSPTNELTLTNMSSEGGTAKATWSFEADGDFSIEDGNLVLATALATVDGVDVSAHAASSSAHHTQAGNLLLNSVVIAGTSLTIDTYRLEKEQVAITLTDIHCITDTGTVIIELMEQDSAGANDATVDAPITCDSNGTEDDGSLTNGTIDAADWLAARIGTEASSPTQVNITWYYTVD